MCSEEYGITKEERNELETLDAELNTKSSKKNIFYDFSRALVKYLNQSKESNNIEKVQCTTVRSNKENFIFKNIFGKIYPIEKPVYRKNRYAVKKKLKELPFEEYSVHINKNLKKGNLCAKNGNPIQNCFLNGNKNYKIYDNSNPKNTWNTITDKFSNDIYYTSSASKSVEERTVAYSFNSSISRKEMQNTDALIPHRGHGAQHSLKPLHEVFHGDKLFTRNNYQLNRSGERKEIGKDNKLISLVKYSLSNDSSSSLKPHEEITREAVISSSPKKNASSLVGIRNHGSTYLKQFLTSTPKDVIEKERIGFSLELRNENYSTTSETQSPHWGVVTTSHTLTVPLTEINDISYISFLKLDELMSSSPKNVSFKSYNGLNKSYNEPYISDLYSEIVSSTGTADISVFHTHNDGDNENNIINYGAEDNKKVEGNLKKTIDEYEDDTMCSKGISDRLVPTDTETSLFSTIPVTESHSFQNDIEFFNSFYKVSNDPMNYTVVLNEIKTKGTQKEVIGVPHSAYSNVISNSPKIPLSMNLQEAEPLSEPSPQNFQTEAAFPKNKSLSESVSFKSSLESGPAIVTFREGFKLSTNDQDSAITVSSNDDTKNSTISMSSFSHRSPYIEGFKENITLFNSEDNIYSKMLIINETSTENTGETGRYWSEMKDIFEPITFSFLEKESDLYFTENTGIRTSEYMLRNTYFKLSRENVSELINQNNGIYSESLDLNNEVGEESTINLPATVSFSTETCTTDGTPKEISKESDESLTEMPSVIYVTAVTETTNNDRDIHFNVTKQAILSKLVLNESFVEEYHNILSHENSRTVQYNEPSSEIIESLSIMKKGQANCSDNFTAIPSDAVTSSTEALLLMNTLSDHNLPSTFLDTVNNTLFLNTGMIVTTESSEVIMQENLIGNESKTSCSIENTELCDIYSEIKTGILYEVTEFSKPHITHFDLDSDVSKHMSETVYFQNNETSGFVNNVTEISEVSESTDTEVDGAERNVTSLYSTMENSAYNSFSVVSSVDFYNSSSTVSSGISSNSGLTDSSLKTYTSNSAASLFGLRGSSSTVSIISTSTEVSSSVDVIVNIYDPLKHNSSATNKKEEKLSQISTTSSPALGFQDSISSRIVEMSNENLYLYDLTKKMYQESLVTSPVFLFSSPEIEQSNESSGTNIVKRPQSTSGNYLLGYNQNSNDLIEGTSKGDLELSYLFSSNMVTENPSSFEIVHFTNVARPSSTVRQNKEEVRTSEPSHTTSGSVTFDLMTYSDIGKPEKGIYNKYIYDVTLKSEDVRSTSLSFEYDKKYISLTKHTEEMNTSEFITSSYTSGGTQVVDNESTYTEESKPTFHLQCDNNTTSGPSKSCETNNFSIYNLSVAAINLASSSNKDESSSSSSSRNLILNNFTFSLPTTEQSFMIIPFRAVFKRYSDLKKDLLN